LSDHAAKTSEQELLARICELEVQLEDCQETLEALRSGDFDAVVITDRDGEPHVYTLETADRPYQFLIERMNEGAVTLSLDGTVLYCNARAAQLLDVPQERIIGQAIERFLRPDDIALLTDLCHAAVTSGVRAELRLRRADLTDIPILFSASPLENGEITILCGVLTDLTDQKRTMQAAVDANTRLLEEIAERQRIEKVLVQSQKLQAIGQLAGGIAHDFNNVLQAVSTGIELIEEHISEHYSEDMEFFLNTIRHSIQHAATLTQRLLSFSRQRALSAQPVELDELVAVVSDLIRQTIGPSISLDVKVKEGCWPVLCDPDQLETALINLAINARDAMPATGGIVTIETNHAILTERDVTGWGASPGDFVHVVVSDTGSGMSPEVLVRALEPFFTTKPLGKGTGLGLSQVYGFITQSNGVMRLDSEPGHGTSVHLYLRRDTASPTRQPASALSAPVASLAAIRILLVEDQDHIRKALAHALRAKGCTVIEAGDGLDGIAALRQVVEAGFQPFDVMVSDIGLPGGLDGCQLAENARTILPDLPVLLITGFAGDAIDQRTRLPSGVEVLTKPFSLDVLTARLQTMLPAEGISSSSKI
jgi:PAS domain S-box-containing protein